MKNGITHHLYLLLIIISVNIWDLHSKKKNKKKILFSFLFAMARERTVVFRSYHNFTFDIYSSMLLMD